MRAYDISRLHIDTTMKSRCCIRSSERWSASVPRSRRCYDPWTNKPTSTVSACTIITSRGFFLPLSVIFWSSNFWSRFLQFPPFVF